jgi:hypothetical protein
VSDQLDALDPERVEQRDLVARQILLLIAAFGRLGPAQPSQVGHQEPVALRQRRHETAPLVPVLRPPVQQQDGLAVFRSGLSQVNPKLTCA